MVEHQDFAIESDVPIVYVTEVLVQDPNDNYNAESLHNSNEWSCPICTLLNSRDHDFCNACHNPSPRSSVHEDSEETPMLRPVAVEEDNNELLASSMEESQKAKVLGSYYEHHRFYDSDHSSDYYEVEEVVDLGESPWGKKMRRRRRRKGRMCAGAIGGAVIGGVLGCGVGAFAGAVAGGIIARRVSKRGEHRKDERVAQEYLLFQKEEMPPRESWHNEDCV